LHRSRSTTKVLSLAFLLLASVPGSWSAAAQTTFKVIVHPTVPGKSIRKQVLADVFLVKVVKWGDGSAIHPVDLSLTSPVRVAFASSVLGFTAFQLNQYWRQEVAKGRVPPPVKQSDDEVIAFVASNPGAIGYVADSAAVPETVKLAEII
jgi:ABC-type phosphate transport system substrate-binding protein